LAIAEKLIAKAQRGDVKAARLIAERTEGRPKQKIDMNMGVDGSVDLRLLSDAELEAQLIKSLAESPDLLQKASRPATSEQTRCDPPTGGAPRAGAYGDGDDGTSQRG
jgi:hypothetical protein